MTMNQAELFCKNETDGNLASIHSNDSLSIVETLSNKSLFLSWIGLMSDNNGSLFWTDGSRVNFTKWGGSMKPQLDHQQCFALKSIYPNDGFIPLHCSYNQPFLCKKKASSCPKTFYNSSLGTMYSSNFPKNYYNNLDCKYIINVPIGKRVEIIFSTFKTQKDYDYLEIWDGPNIGEGFLIGNFSGSSFKTWKNIYSTGNYMSLKFHTDSSITNTGWLGLFYAKTIPPIINVTGSSGELTSPNYPQKYDYNEDQYYLITGTEKSKINIIFVYFYTEPKYDYLVIYDGPSLYSKKLITLSGYMANSTSFKQIQSSQNKVLLHFVSDYVFNYNGFFLKWKTF